MTSFHKHYSFLPMNGDAAFGDIGWCAATVQTRWIATRSGASMDRNVYNGWAGNCVVGGVRLLRVSVLPTKLNRVSRFASLLNVACVQGGKGVTRDLLLQCRFDRLYSTADPQFLFF